MHLTVTGTGRASLVPERATVRLELSFEGFDLASVLEETNELVERVTEVVDALKRQSPSPTTWSAVLPTVTRSWVPNSEQGEPQRTRFGAAAEVKVKFCDFVELARFIAAVGSEDGVHVHEVQWTLTEKTRREREAEVLSNAVSDARRRAQVMARAGSGGEVRLVEIADPGLLGGGRTGSGGDSGMSLRMMSAGGGAPELRPEDVVIEAAVHARFEA